MSELKEIAHEFEFGGAKCSLSTGKIARRSGSAVVGRMGDTVVLVNVNWKAASDSNEFFPLTVEYIERMFAGGVISSSRFIKREGFPSDEAMLVARMIDRSVRSRFPSDYRDEVQVIVTVLSYDPKCDPAVISFNAVSAALMLSGVPFDGPVAGLRVGLAEGKPVVYCKDVVEDEENRNPAETPMNLVLGSDGKLATMFDMDATEVGEKEVLDGIKFGVEQSAQLIKAQQDFVDKVVKEKGAVVKDEYVSFAIPKELISEVQKNHGKELEKALAIQDAKEREDALEEIKESIYPDYEGKYSKSQVGGAYTEVCKKITQKWLLEDGKRADGRKVDEFRQISIETGVLPRAHGSVLFTRGMTQAITTVTLGSEKLVQLVQGMEGENTRRYMHHYNAPDYTVGELGKFNYRPGRREIGHGALAEKAVVPVLPDSNKFPYAIRVVSEIMSQSGSSSMASVCGSSLSLMDAGVPITAPVAGVAMGVILSDDRKKWIVLTDLAENEDFYGHMDFKVAGTAKGVTAIQMDNKAAGIPFGVIEEGLEKAKQAREFLLEKMNAVIAEPRKALSKYAPKIEIIEIPKSKIGELIGPGGKIIKAIIEETGAEIEISDDGKVAIASPDEASRAKAREKVESIIEEPEVGKIYTGKVAKVAEFGAFVDVSPAISGLVHVSEMSDTFVKDPNDIVKEGQEVQVKVIGIDERGRVKMSMKQVSGSASSPAKSGSRPYGKPRFGRKFAGKGGKPNGKPAFPPDVA